MITERIKKEKERKNDNRKKKKERKAYRMNERKGRWK